MRGGGGEKEREIWKVEKEVGMRTCEIGVFSICSVLFVFSFPRCLWVI